MSSRLIEYVCKLPMKKYIYIYINNDYIRSSCSTFCRNATSNFQIHAALLTSEPIIKFSSLDIRDS
jgi:hypothetical protein